MGITIFLSLICNRAPSARAAEVNSPQLCGLAVEGDANAIKIISELNLAKIPHIESIASELFNKLFRIPMGELTEENLRELKVVINFANEQFKRRNWPVEFLEERFQIAVKLAKRSSYAYTRSFFTGEVNGSIGLTVAEYSQDDLLGETYDKLGMEATHGWKLARPSIQMAKE